MAKENKLTFITDNSAPAPKPKGKIAEVPELKEALDKLPKGANMLVRDDQVAIATTRVYVQRAQKAEGDKPETTRRTFVTRLDKEASGLRIWAV